MKVATTIFVGNISDKATDTLVRQILLVSSMKGLFDVILYTCDSVLFYIWQSKSTFLCNSCSDAAELKAGNESRMPPGSFKVRLFIFVTILGPRVWVVWFIADSMANGLCSLFSVWFLWIWRPRVNTSGVEASSWLQAWREELSGKLPWSHSQFSFLTMAWEWDVYLILGEGGCENSQRSVEVHLQKEEHQKELTSRWRVGKSSSLSLVLWYVSQPMNRHVKVVDSWAMIETVALLLYCSLRSWLLILRRRITALLSSGKRWMKTWR